MQPPDPRTDGYYDLSPAHAIQANVHVWKTEWRGHRYAYRAPATQWWGADTAALLAVEFARVEGPAVLGNHECEFAVRFVLTSATNEVAPREYVFTMRWRQTVTAEVVREGL